VTVGVLIMAYGTPTGPDDIASYYTDVRRGRPPSPAQLEDLERRYHAIGGSSPLAARTASQVSAVQRALDQRRPGSYTTYFGAKHARPRIEDAVAAMAADGITVAVGLVLAPHYSALSVGEYEQRAAAGCRGAGIDFTMLRSWHDNETLIELLAERVAAARSRLARRAAESRGDSGHAARLEVLFTAHSLPARILETDDPYPRELEATAALVGEAAQLSSWRTAWQSAGRTAEPWIGPDILVMLAELAAEGVTDVVICPAGFTSDHLEVLYDVDIEAQKVAGDLGVALERTASLNDDPRLAAALADLVIATLGEQAGRAAER